MNNKKFVIGAVVAVALIAIIAFVYREYSDSTVASDTEQTNSMSLTNATPTAEVNANANTLNAAGNSATKSTTPGSTTKPKLSYAAALIEYTDKRIQLDTSCGASPKEVTYKNGTNIMLDNRAGVARKIMFNAKAYSIPAYDYIVVSASSTTLPGITYLDCGDKQNVARITIQK